MCIKLVSGIERAGYGNKGGAVYLTIGSGLTSFTSVTLTGVNMMANTAAGLYCCAVFVLMLAKLGCAAFEF